MVLSSLDDIACNEAFVKDVLAGATGACCDGTGIFNPAIFASFGGGASFISNFETRGGLFACGCAPVPGMCCLGCTPVNGAKALIKSAFSTKPVDNTPCFTHIAFNWEILAVATSIAPDVDFLLSSSELLSR